MIWGETVMDFGQCVCGGLFASRQVEVRLMTSDGERAIQGVPQGTCLRCGVRVYRANIVSLLEQAKRATRDPSHDDVPGRPLVSRLPG
jgi:hypothetical protein